MKFSKLFISMVCATSFSIHAVPATITLVNQVGAGIQFSIQWVQSGHAISNQSLGAITNNAPTPIPVYSNANAFAIYLTQNQLSLSLPVAITPGRTYTITQSGNQINVN